MKKPYKIGDKVRKFSSYREKKLMKEIFTVKRVYKAFSQTGWCIDAAIDECPHCGRAEKSIKGFDSDWFVKA